MKKLTRLAGFIFFALVLSAQIFAQSDSLPGYIFDGDAVGIKSTGASGRLREGTTDQIPFTLRWIGGVIFQTTAVPVGNAAGQAVSISYDAAKPDGQRLTVTIGMSTVTQNLYDWQFIPVALFADSGFTACMTLFGFPETKEEKQMHSENDHALMWAEYHPALAKTLIGMNLFFIDAMFINPERMRKVSDGFSGIITGYNDTIINQTRSGTNSEQISGWLFIEQNINHSYNSYIYTDYGTKITYQIKNGQIVFTGIPTYQFLYNNDRDGTVTVATSMNSTIKSVYYKVRAINPIVYSTAEKTAQWAAFFRMLREQNMDSWNEFIKQIDGIEPAPAFETPRAWLP
jgi:hypothetical protein